MIQNAPITLTWLDANAWLLDIPGQRILIDPWLIGDLVFNQAAWLIRGVRPQPVPIPDAIDLILLSQGLADHAHPETLRALAKSVPVIASVSGAKVAQALGFTTVRALLPGETLDIDQVLRIQAFPGAPLGPLVRENAYLITVLASGLTLYYEPHGYPAAQLADLPGVDVAITPIVSIQLPLLGALIQGAEGALPLAKLLQPQWLLPTAEGGNIRYTGLLTKLWRQWGGVEALQAQLAAAGLRTQIKPLQPLESLFCDLIPVAERSV